MPQPLTSNQEWSLGRKTSFRFFCSFFLLYVIPFPINNIPFAGEIEKISKHILGWYFDAIYLVYDFWQWFIPAVGKNILHLKTPITTFTNGSGDTTYDYVLIFTQIALAILIAIAWSIIDKRRKTYNTAYYWLCAIVRYFLAGMMLSYGFTKVFHAQMPYPSLTRLLQPYGDSSPMGLAWTYVGQSKAFSVFAGCSEVVCGLLLLFRKTTLVGALLSLMVMGNVVVMNFCYDVPVKLFSSTLELMALYLAAPYFKKMFRIFILHQPGEIENYVQPDFSKKWFAMAVKIFKFLIIADAIFYGIKSGIESSNSYGDNAPKPPLYGIYNTELFLRNNDTIAPLTTDTTRWRQIIIQSEKAARIKLMNDTLRRYSFEVDTLTKTALVYPNSDTLTKNRLSYITTGDYLILSGRMKSDSVYMKLKRYDEKNFRLMNRGFHWINEFPFNR
jgi:uncharacterized membrane protein YphA (DoxX/SURF4 family)